MAKRINGRCEGPTGAYTHYQIGKSTIVTRAEGVRRQKAGELPGYNVIKVNGVAYLRDNPDKRKSDNIDEQPLI